MFCTSNSCQFPFSLHWVCHFNLLVKTTFLPLFNIHPATKSRKQSVNILLAETRHIHTFLQLCHILSSFLNCILSKSNKNMLFFFAISCLPSLFFKDLCPGVVRHSVPISELTDDHVAHSLEINQSIRQTMLFSISMSKD